MTAMKDAFAKAGADTKALELRAAANDALEAAKGNAERAALRFVAILKKRSELLETLAFDYLKRLAAERGLPEPAAAIAPIGHRVREHKVREYHRRSHAEREAALQGAGRVAASLRTAYDRQIDGRSLGELRWGELQALRHQHAIDAASFLRFGTQATADFLLLDKIEAHCRVDDHTTKVREAIGEEQLRALSEEADAEAPRLISAGMQRYIATLEQDRQKALSSS